MSKAQPPPQWKSSRKRNPIAHLGWPALSKENAARVIKLVCPKPDQHDDCLREAEINVQWIKRKTAITQSAGERKEALHKVAKNIAAVITSLNNLPIATLHELHPEAFQRSLDQTLALAEKITVKRSGGKKRGSGSRIDAAKKRAAADCAFDILWAWSSRGRPTLYRGGPYFELAALLFELATGKRDGDVERACARVYKERMLHNKISSRHFEEWEMMFEFDGEPKAFEEND
jgi:hypothetical protein